MAGQNQGGPNLEQFETYFRRADTDHDGRISGAEAVAFFQGSNLSKQVLAQIWMFADQSRCGFLSRAEFYNALKLVTVAQSKRELTPDIVKAALYGPASSKIPAPKINLAATPAPQFNPVGTVPAMQPGVVAPVASQNLGFRAQPPPNQNMNQQYRPLQGTQLVRPPLPTALGPASHPPGGVPNPGFPRGAGLVGPSPPNSNVLTDWLGGGTAGAPAGTTTPNRATSPSMPSVATKPQEQVSASSLAAKDPRVVSSSGNGFAADSIFGGDIFSATQAVPKQPALGPTSSVNNTVISSAIVPPNAVLETSAKADRFAALQNTYAKTPASSQPLTQSLPNTNQQVQSQVSPSFSSSGVPVGGGNSTLEQSQPWPKMTHLKVQKYAKLFMEVDTDRDSKITGEQARNLFLSWRLPREVLKQVWDLSDQDNDSMLSLREFCIALYLMEQYRDGRTLPSTLPASIMLDETLLTLAGPPSASYGNAGWALPPGVRPQEGVPGAQQILPTGVRPPSQPVYPQADRTSLQLNQQNARGLSVENSHVNALSNGEQNSLDISQEAAEAESKVAEKKVILDSKEKLEFYRTKMQDLVLYKSRCENRLNEITERAIADKREAELLAKKYEEKYKQVAEIASKLTIEEASFRDIQERKMELQQAITKVEQGGSVDGLLQVRADRIQSDLEELLKALTERCKKHGISVKSAAVIELPPGWQPGIPEVAAVWDEDWDKFEDEGFSFDVAVPVGAKLASSGKENSSPAHSLSSDSVSNTDKSDKVFGKDVGNLETESSYSHSEDGSKSPHGSPTRQTAFESPIRDSDNHFGKNSDADSESQRGFDDSNWGTFDNNDDIDSVWGFGTKESGHDKHGEGYFFGTNEFDGSPGRTDSPQAGGSFQKNSAFSFEDSVPSTPLSRAGNSPRGFDSGRGDSFFDNFSRYDSFSQHDQSSSPRRNTLTRFDSVNSARSFDHSRGFSFDDSDPFGSSGPFKVSSDSQSPRKSSENWNAF